MEDTTLEAMQDIIDALNRRSPLFHQTLSAARQTIALEPIFSDLLEESVQTISLAQRFVIERACWQSILTPLRAREGTRCFKSIVQKELTDQYQLVAKESGPGSWARMKVRAFLPCSVPNFMSIVALKPRIHQDECGKHL